MRTTKLIGALALSLPAFAFASQVTLYGVVDESLFYTHSRVDGVSSNSLQMKSGYNAGSRFGLRGSEDLGGGVKVGFKLESGFTADTGELQKKRLFHREAQLNVSGPWGTLAAGRLGGVGSGATTYDLVYSIGEVSDASWLNVEGMHMTGRSDNMLVYQTPKFGGLQATVQYSFKSDSLNTDEGDEGTAKATRYYGGALTYSAGAFESVLAYEYINRGNNTATYQNPNQRNGQAVSLGGNYDFGLARVYALFQYADGADSLGRLYASNVKKAYGGDSTFFFDGFKGWTAHLGANIPLPAGYLRAGVYYADAKIEGVRIKEAAKQKGDIAFYGVNAQYNYPLSKRTQVYTGAGFGSSKIKGNEDARQYKSEEATAYVGLTHKF